MLLAQMYSKHKQQQEARREELIRLQAEKARMLGGNTMGLEAADFNRRQQLQNFASPQELMQIYGTLDKESAKKPAPTDGPTSTSPGSDSLLNPWNPNRTLRQPNDDSFVPFGDDPYGLNIRI